MLTTNRQTEEVLYVDNPLPIYDTDEEGEEESQAQASGGKQMANKNVQRRDKSCNK